MLICLKRKRDVDRTVVANGCAAGSGSRRVVRLALGLLRQDGAGADRAGRILPVGDDVRHRRSSGRRLNVANLAGMGP